MIINGIEIEFIDGPKVMLCRFETGAVAENAWRIGFFGTFRAQPRRGLARHRFKYADFWFIDNPLRTTGAALEKMADRAAKEGLEKLEIFEISKETVRVFGREKKGQQDECKYPPA